MLARTIVTNRIVARQGTIEAAITTGSNEENRSVIFPIRNVVINVPIPAAVPPMPLTEPTTRVWNTSAGSERNIVEHEA